MRQQNKHFMRNQGDRRISSNNHLELYMLNEEDNEGTSDDVLQCGPLPCVLWIAVGVIILFICTTSLVMCCICRIRRRRREHVYERVPHDDDGNDDGNEEPQVNIHEEEVNEVLQNNTNSSNTAIANNNNNKSNHNSNEQDKRSTISNNNHDLHSSQSNKYHNSHVTTTTTKVIQGTPVTKDNSSKEKSTQLVKNYTTHEDVLTHIDKHDNQFQEQVKSATSRLATGNEKSIVNGCHSNETNNTADNTFLKTHNANVNNDNNLTDVLPTKSHEQTREIRINEQKVRNGTKLTRNAVAKFNLDSPSQFQTISAATIEPIITKEPAAVATPKEETNGKLDELEKFTLCKHEVPDLIHEEQQQQQQHFAEPWQPVVVNRNNVTQKRKSAANESKRNSAKSLQSTDTHHTQPNVLQHEWGKEHMAPYLQDDLSVLASTTNYNDHEEENKFFPEHELSADDLMLKEAVYNTQTKNTESYQSIMYFKDSGSLFSSNAQTSG